MQSLNPLAASTYSPHRGIRLICALMGIGVSSPAVALDQKFAPSADGCSCSLPAQSSIDGCFAVSSNSIFYDIVVTGLTNADVTEAKVVRAVAVDSCTPQSPEVELFPLDRFSNDPAAPARFVGHFPLPLGSTRGVCPTDPADCLVQGEALVQMALATAEDCKNMIIKDPAACASVIPTVSEWGVVVMIALVMAVGTAVFRYRRAPLIQSSGTGDDTPA